MDRFHGSPRRFLTAVLAGCIALGTAAADPVCHGHPGCASDLPGQQPVVAGPPAPVWPKAVGPANRRPATGPGSGAQSTGGWSGACCDRTSVPLEKDIPQEPAFQRFGTGNIHCFS